MLEHNSVIIGVSLGDFHLDGENLDQVPSLSSAGAGTDFSRDTNFQAMPYPSARQACCQLAVGHRPCETFASQSSKDLALSEFPCRSLFLRVKIPKVTSTVDCLFTHLAEPRTISTIGVLASSSNCQLHQPTHICGSQTGMERRACLLEEKGAGPVQQADSQPHLAVRRGAASGGDLGHSRQAIGLSLSLVRPQLLSYNSRMWQASSATTV